MAETSGDLRGCYESAPSLDSVHAHDGANENAIAQMKSIVRKYPQFADIRAALTAAYWENGKPGEAESNWVAAYGLDSRYKDINWVKNVRRWPPSLVVALDKFLRLQ